MAHLVLATRTTRALGVLASSREGTAIRPRGVQFLALRTLVGRNFAFGMADWLHANDARFVLLLVSQFVDDGLFGLIIGFRLGRSGFAGRLSFASQSHHRFSRIHGLILVRFGVGVFCGGDTIDIDMEQQLDGLLLDRFDHGVVHLVAFALAFAGQSTPWPVALTDQSANPVLNEALHAHADAAQALLYPVSADLLATTGRPVDLFGFEPNPARLGAAAAASASVPGIALAQLGALLDAASLGYNPAVAKPVAVLGHSQGVLAVHMVQSIVEAGSIEAASAQIDEILAIATLIGVAGTRQARQLGLAARHGEATPMLSVKDITRAQVDALIKRVSGARGPIAVAVTNSATHYVLSGYPEDLAAFGVEVAKEHKHQAKLREEKVRGGRVFEPVLEYLDVTLPFHSPLMADAVSQAVSWAESCGIDADHARELAAEVLLNHVDWAARVRALMKSTDPSALWVLDFGPGTTVGKLFSTVAQGTGVGVVEASTVADRGELSTLETLPERTQNWTRFAPSIIHTSAGDKVRTAFTELTGKAPVLLAVQPSRISLEDGCR